jgi:hypothetical protein
LNISSLLLKRVSPKTDIGQIYFLKLILLKIFVPKTPSIAMVTELTGINIADNNGDRCPLIAKYNPTQLYRIETINVNFTNEIVFRLKFKNLLSAFNPFSSTIISHAGLKLFF